MPCPWIVRTFPRRSTPTLFPECVCTECDSAGLRPAPGLSFVAPGRAAAFVAPRPLFTFEAPPRPLFAVAPPRPPFAVFVPGRPPALLLVVPGRPPFAVEFVAGRPPAVGVFVPGLAVFPPVVVPGRAPGPPAVFVPGRPPVAPVAGCPPDGAVAGREGAAAGLGAAAGFACGAGAFGGGADFLSFAKAGIANAIESNTKFLSRWVPGFICGLLSGARTLSVLRQGTSVKKTISCGALWGEASRVGHNTPQVAATILAFPAVVNDFFRRYSPLLAITKFAQCRMINIAQQSGILARVAQARHTPKLR